MRSVKKIHNARYSPVEDLLTWSPLPSRSLEQIDPFLFLHHHGPQEYPENNSGLPFGPHPHRGIETVTFILEGDILHKDNQGHVSIITGGGIQWMTAGSGLVHAEVSSDNFREKGGKLEILQLWINLPSKLKMTQPAYTGFQKEDIPYVITDSSKVKINIISGRWGETEGAYKPVQPVSMSTIEFKSTGTIHIKVPEDENIFLYIVRGSLTINGTNCEFRQLIEFSNDDENINISALTGSYIIFGHARPLNEPVVAQGPFVMNTMEEIRQAYDDYRAGRFGTID